MSVKVGINGFGRIGRNLFRAAWERRLDLEFVAVNDITDAATLAHLTKYDSTLGPVPGQGRAGRRLDQLRRQAASRCWPSATRPSCRGGTSASRSWSSPPGSSPTARAPPSTSRRAPSKVIISAPAKDPDVTVALGVNFDEAYDRDSHHIISNASCTTNCLAPVAKVLNDGVGIRHGLMTTIHAYTADQRLQDMPHKDLRRARAAAINLIPTSTGAAKAIGLVVPELDGKLNGIAVRAPVATGSVVDLVCEVAARDVDRGGQRLFSSEADTGRYEGILALHRGPDRLDRHQQVAVLVDLRLAG